MNNRAFVAIKMSRRQGARRAYPAEASPAQEYRLRLKLPSASHKLARHLPFQSSARLATPRLLRFPGLLPRVAQLTLRFRLEKYAQHTFSTKTERRKNSGSSQSLASLLRFTEPTNQID
jgi:hypothetical protein